MELLRGWTAAHHWELTEQLFNETLVFTARRFMASTWASPFCTIIAVTCSGCMTANRKPTDEPMSERYSAYEERFSFSVNFSVTNRQLQHG
jgi:hypothetical protein